MSYLTVKSIRCSGELDRIFYNTFCIIDVPCLPEKVSLYTKKQLPGSLVPDKKANTRTKLWYNKVCWARSKEVVK